MNPQILEFGLGGRQALAIGTHNLAHGAPATTLAYGRAGACCACSRCGTDGLFVYICFHLAYHIFLF